MQTIRHLLRAALFPALTLSVLGSFLSSSAAPAPSAKSPAGNWAGALDGIPTRASRAGAPGALPRSSARGKFAVESFAGPAVTPSSGPLDGTWTLLAGTGGNFGFDGPGRVTHSAIYDPVRNRIVIFGGGDGAGYLNDT